MIDKPEYYSNPVSPALPLIPRLCPICGQEQFDGIKAVEDDNPYAGSGEGIEDIKIGEQWSVCHVSCKYWFRDQVVNDLVNIGNEVAVTNISETAASVAEFDQLHEAIRNSIDMEELISMLGHDRYIK